MPLLSVDNLNVHLASANGPLHVVRGVSLSIEKGETLSIVGESGCGKSVTSLALMGLLPQGAQRTADRLDLLGKPIGRMSETQLSDVRGSEMSMIFQEPMTALNPVLSIGEQLEETYLRHNRAPRSEARDRAVHLLERVGITAARERLRQFPHQLSGGLRQRVVIAMALMCRPALIIADEPTTALDVTVQAQILRLLKDLQEEFEVGVLLITHDLGVVARTADRVSVMYAGSFVETGTTREVFADPVHPYTRGLLEAIPVPGRKSVSRRLAAIPGSVPSPAETPAGCPFAPRCTFRVEACMEKVEMQGTPHGRGWRCIEPWRYRSGATVSRGAPA